MKPAAHLRGQTVAEMPDGNLLLPGNGELSASELLLLFMKDLKTLKTENMAKWFDGESKLWLPPADPAVGARRILALFGLIFRRYRNLSWTVQAVYPAGARKLIYATESRGIFADGRPYANDILTVIEFSAEGKIRFLSDYFKDTAIFGRTQAAVQTDQKLISKR